jgi:hypothetical protein
VLLADDLMIGEPPIMQQMTELFARIQCSILAVQEVPKSQTNRYGIVKGLPVAADLVNVQGLIEKPHPQRRAVKPRGCRPLCADAGRFRAHPRTAAGQRAARFSSPTASPRCWPANGCWPIVITADATTVAASWD